MRRILIALVLLCAASGPVLAANAQDTSKKGNVFQTQQNNIENYKPKPPPPPTPPPTTVAPIKPPPAPAKK